MIKVTFLKVLVFAGVIMTTYSCNNNKNRIPSVPDAHTAQISLDWHGTYSGNLPCADCERIETELTLNEDLSYELISTYFKGDDTFSDTLQGEFSWEGNNVKLEGITEDERSSLFKVEENQVRCLDMEGRVVEGELERNYILKKNGNPLVEDRRWRIVEIYGKPVEGTSDNYYLIFDSGEGRIAARVNCNILNYSYKIKNEYQVSFGQGLSTLMACPDNLEDEFKEVLEMADNLSTDGKYLSLNKARMAPLARFVLDEGEQQEE